MDELDKQVFPLPLTPLPKKSRRFPLAPVIGKSLLATIATVAAISGIAALTTGADFWRHIHSADNLSDSDRQVRSQAFATLSSMRLLLVSDHDTATALDGMQLSPPAKEALAKDLLAPAAEPAVAPVLQQAPQRNAAVAVQPALKPTKSAPVQLAWITLWDTDVEDGDVVRIDSRGYSRTVTLTTKPQIFAVPVPVDGVIQVTGVLDGEGGGITVGLGSGAAQAVFPVMSVGQTLGLKVKVD